MYWKEKEIEVNDTTYVKYCYFKLQLNSHLPQPFYNSETQSISYPIMYDLVIEGRLCPSEEAFLDWYHKNKRL